MSPRPPSPRLALSQRHALTVPVRLVRGGWAMVVGLLRRPPRIERLLLAPPDLRSGDPAVAQDLYEGRLVLAGKAVEARGAPIFELDAPSHAFAEELHGFAWLRHLRAAETGLARAHARALVQDWLHASGAHHPAAWGVAARARRLISLVGHSPMLLEGADAGFYRQFLRWLGQEAAQLERLALREADPERRLLALIALVHLGLAASPTEAFLRRVLATLSRELDRVIHEDGGPLSRNPRVAMDLLLDLLPLKLAFAARKVAIPPAVQRVLDTLPQFLRLLRLGDGALAQFNGMGATEFAHLSTILALAEGEGVPEEARASGYQRLARGDTVIVLDTGPAPPAAVAGQAHAAPGAFEISVGTQRVIVSCGAAPAHRHALRRASRRTAAHSTLVIGDHDAGRLIDDGDGGPLQRGAMEVTVERVDSAEGSMVVMIHDGYRALGFRHRRDVALAADGYAIEGNDSLLPLAGGTAAGEALLRFHLHPLIGVTPREGGADLLLPDDSLWRFSATDAPVTVEESTILAAAEGMRPTRQLVVGPQAASGFQQAWSLRRVNP